MKRLKQLSAKKSLLISAACTVVFLMLCAYCYRTNVRDVCLSSGINETVVGECVQNTRIEQTVTIPPTANKLSLLLATYQREMQGQLTVRLVRHPDGSPVQEWTIPNETILDNQYYALELKDDFSRGNTDDRYAIVVESDSSCRPGSSPTIWCSSADRYSEGDLFINGERSEGDLCFLIHYQSMEIARIYGLMVGILFLLLTALILLPDQLGNRIEVVFVICVLALGIAYMIALPADSAPDEVRHIISAYNVSNIMLGGPRAENSLVYFRAEDLGGLYEAYPNGQTYISLYANFFKGSWNEDYVLMTKDFIIPTPFWTYLPQAAGISLGRILHCNGTVTILLGRLFSLLFFTGVTYWSIKIIPFGKKILFAVSLLPMTLELIASYSYDTMILALAFLYIALMCRLIFEKETLAIRDIILPAVVFALLAPHKYVYTVLALLALLLPGGKYKAKKEKWISVGILLGGMALAMLSMVGKPQVVVSGSEPPLYRTVGYCLRHIPEMVDVYWATVVQKMPYYVSTMVGMLLGWLELQMPQEVLALAVLMMFMATVKTESENRQLLKGRHCFTFFLCVFLVFFMTLTAMLLVWTPSWCMEIEGVQGRYFLPVLPLLLLCVRKMEIRSAKSMVKPVAYVGFCMNAICLLRCFLIITGR